MQPNCKWKKILPARQSTTTNLHTHYKNNHKNIILAAELKSDESDESNDIENNENNENQGPTQNTGKIFFVLIILIIKY